MADFKIKTAINNYIIVEPFEKSTVLKTEEVSTVFKVISIGVCGEIEREIDESTAKGKDLLFKASVRQFNYNDLIIVAKGSIEKTLMGQKEIY